MILLAVDSQPGRQRVLATSGNFAPGVPEDDARSRFSLALTRLWARANKQAELAHVVVVPLPAAIERYPEAVDAWLGPDWRPAWSAWPTAGLLPLQQPQEYRAGHPAA